MTEDQIRSEILSGDALNIAQAARIVPGFRGNENIDQSTVWRWINHGAKDTSGRIVKLGAARLGGRWLTSRGALARFMAALTDAAEPAPAARSERERQRSAEAANARLAAAGA